MNDKFERKWKEKVVAKIVVISRHSPGGAEESQKEPQPG
jgi:hypothetical protein